MSVPVRPAAVLVAGATVALGLVLGGCAGVPSGPTASAPHTTQTAEPTQSPAPAPAATAPPALVPGGTAAQNLPYFDAINKATIAAKPGAQGRDFIDALVAAGFTKTDMQLTPDTTSIGLASPSIQFSVQFGAGCVIGQYGPDRAYYSLTSPTLATGGCLIGRTRPIDW